MDPDTLIEQIRTNYQQVAGILGIDYTTATSEEKHLIEEASPMKPHHKEWFAGITHNWLGYTGGRVPWV